MIELAMLAALSVFAFWRLKADLSTEQVAQTRALKRLNFFLQLLRFSVPRAY
jgi:hypothetical protein